MLNLSVYRHIKRECNFGDHTPFYAYNYNTEAPLNLNP